MKLSRPRIMALLATLFLLSASAAQAHGLHVFAWLESDHIIVDGSFGKDRPARDAVVTVIDATNQAQLLHGKTNQQGRFTFPVPEVVRLGHPLTIQINAGQGHQGQWQLNPQELYAAASLAAGFETADLASPNQPPNLPMVQSTAPVEQLRAIVQRELEAQLSPIRQELAARHAAGPSLVEIIGGLGWIIGLVGVGLYFKSRKGA